MKQRILEAVASNAFGRFVIKANKGMAYLLITTWVFCVIMAFATHG